MDEPFRLTPFRIKVREFQALGVELLYVLRFNQALAGRSAEDFLSNLLHSGIGPAHVVVGYNLKFGSGREGDFDLLAARGRGGVRGLGTVPARALRWPGRRGFGLRAL